MTDEILTYIENGVGHIELNRPHALNALSTAMIEGMTETLDAWQDDPGIRVVILTGAGERAFCAGGDIKKAREAGLACKRGDLDFSAVFRFYGLEYNLNRRIFHYPKPIVAFMRGITMGGGYGLAGPCRYRIAAENSVFAMPEVGIGFFPDVGSVYLMNRYPGQTGTYLCVTGQSIKAADMMFAGIGTHYIPLENQAACIDEIKAFIDARDNAEGTVQDILDRYGTQPEGSPGPVESHQDIINECFAGDDVRDIIAKLKENGSVWALEQAEIIESRAPLSLAVSLKHYRQAAGDSFDEVLARDFALSQQFMHGEDFYEGVRAAVVDKDKNPQWKPSRLADITAEMVDACFSAGLYGLGDFDPSRHDAAEN